MENKKSARERFLDRFFGGVEDWDKYLTDSISQEENAYDYEYGLKILEVQEQFGNRTNSELGREMWYSNDFFINSLILNFITDAEDDLVTELKQIYVGLLGIREFNAEAMEMIEESEEYLITMNFEIDQQLTYISTLFSYYIYGMYIPDEERDELYPKMVDSLRDLVDKEALMKKISNQIPYDDVPVDYESPRLHIATDLFVASMSFVLGHEIGHHFLNHTGSNGRNIISKFIPTDVTFNQLHLDEFAADNFSFDLLIRGMKEKNANTLFAPLMVIFMLAIYDKTPEESSQTHPSLRDRYLNLLSKVSEQDEKLALSLQSIMNELASWINDILKGHGKTEWWR
ncbi:hypothetical protein [Peribacillus sp. NPDC058002]|uniref:hypothetical protein n=1 Tax=Peribacillus sp. NPDC058002 TaxID=3346301 RepID=UPI0036DD9693